MSGPAVVPPRRFEVSRALLALLLLAVLPGLPAAASPRRRTKDPNVSRTALSHPCSRPLSRAVRKHLAKEILEPAAEAGADKWPRGCSLDPALDLWAEHEKQKQSKRFPGSSWTCGICGKKFKTEHYLDLHMERKHMNETPANGVCIAKYCELFNACHEHVEHGHKHGSAKRRHGRARKRQQWHGSPHVHHAPCNDTLMAQSREICETAMAKCFPPEKAGSRGLYGQFSRTHCRTLDCQIRAEQEASHHSRPTPLIIPLVSIVLVFALVALAIFCCLENSEWIAGFLTSRRLASEKTARSMTRITEQTREMVGLERLHRV